MLSVQWLITHFAISTLLTLGSAFAEDPKPVPFAAGTTQEAIDMLEKPGAYNKKAIEDPNFSECKGACLYSRANENITLQAFYMMNKHDLLNDDKRDESEKRKALGGFCRGGVNEEPIDDCVDRWNNANSFWFASAKGAIKKNKSVQDQLKHGDGDSNKFRGLAITPTYEAGKKPPEPKYLGAGAFSTAQELAEQAKNNTQLLLQANGDQPGEQSVANSLRPNREDFIKYKELPDPTDPTKTITIPLTKTVIENGKSKEILEIDENAYGRALQKWQETFGDRKILAETTKDGKDWKQKRKETLDEFKSEFSMSPIDPNKSFLRQQYDKAHDIVVDEANNGIWGKKEINLDNPPPVFKGDMTVKYKERNLSEEDRRKGIKEDNKSKSLYIGPKEFNKYIQIQGITADDE